MELTTQMIGGAVVIALLLIIYGYAVRIFKISKEILRELKKKQ